VKDIYTPEICENINIDDHLLIDYKFILANNSIGLAIMAPNQLFYVQLSDLNGDLVIVKNLKEMCLNSTRSLQFESSFGVDFSPFLPLNSTYSRLSESMTVIIHISTVTKQSDFSIFDAINSGNSSMVLDLIEEHRGINAVDQWGQSALMFAVSSQSLLLFSALMNTRRPTVNVNLMKSSGFTALFYAVEKAPFAIVQALLRRCSLLMPYWTSLFVLRRTCRQSSLYETLFHCNILSKYHHYYLVFILLYMLHIPSHEYFFLIVSILHLCHSG
jgi:hypothetical protein